MLVEHFRDLPGFPGSFSDYFAVRTGANEISGGANNKLVAWSIDAVPNGVEHYGLDADPLELDSLHAAGGQLAAERAAMRASLAVLRRCGMPGQASCASAETVVEELFYGGFD